MPRGPSSSRATSAGTTRTASWRGSRRRGATSQAARTGPTSTVAWCSVRPLVDQLLVAECPLPAGLAELLGWEGAEQIAAALEQAAPLAPLVPGVAELRRKGASFPAEWLARRLAAALETRLATLPEAAGEALLVLDLAAAAGVQLDLGPGQVQAFAGLLPAAPGGPTLAALRE